MLSVNRILVHPFSVTLKHQAYRLARPWEGLRDAYADLRAFLAGHDAFPGHHGVHHDACLVCRGAFRAFHARAAIRRGGALRWDHPSSMVLQALGSVQP